MLCREEIETSRWEDGSSKPSIQDPIAGNIECRDRYQEILNIQICSDQKIFLSQTSQFMEIHHSLNLQAVENNTKTGVDLHCSMKKNRYKDGCHLFSVPCLSMFRENDYLRNENIFRLAIRPQFLSTDVGFLTRRLLKSSRFGVRQKQRKDFKNAKFRNRLNSQKFTYSHKHKDVIIPVINNCSMTSYEGSIDDLDSKSESITESTNSMIEDYVDDIEHPLSSVDDTLHLDAGYPDGFFFRDNNGLLDDDEVYSCEASLSGMASLRSKSLSA